MFHYPTNTVAEILPADLKIAHYYGPKREFISKGPGGMTIGLMVFINRTTAENLEPVFDKIEDCYYKGPSGWETAAVKNNYDEKSICKFHIRYFGLIYPRLVSEIDP